MHEAAPPFAHSRGPHTNVRIAFVAEAWGEKEEMLRAPLVGPAGREFARILADAKLAPPLPTHFMGELEMFDWWPEVLDRGRMFLTNVFAFRPRNNDISTLCCAKKELPDDYDLPPIDTGKYVRPEYLGELRRLGEELTAVAPNLVVPLGATACWAILRSRAIGSIRGAVAPSVCPTGFKCLPTYHPSAVLRAAKLRPILLADLLKAKDEAQFAEIRRPRRQVLVRPTLDEIAEWSAEAVFADALAVDIETLRGGISYIGFATSADRALCIPFFDPEAPDGNYWNENEEPEAWFHVAKLLGSAIPKVFQNGLYDLQYLVRMGIRVNNCAHDTMILHHARYPELQKGLGFLTSIYSNESAYKTARRTFTIKREE